MEVDENDDILVPDIIIAMEQPVDNSLQDAPMIPQQIASPTEEASAEEDEVIRFIGSIQESIRVKSFHPGGRWLLGFHIQNLLLFLKS